MQARERLYITADKKRLVAEGDPDGAFLYAAPGDTIPDSAVEKFGLVDGKLSSMDTDEKRQGGGDNKDRKDGEDKDRKDGSDKDTQESQKTGGAGDGAGPASDLTRIKGIGAKTAGALAKAGIDTFAKLAAIDRANPPVIDGIAVSTRDWLSWTGQAEVLAAVSKEG